MDDSKIWELQEIKDKISIHTKAIDRLSKQRTELEMEILEQLDEAHLSLARTSNTDDTGKRVTVSINEQDVAHVKDWAEFEEYIYDNRALYLLQRRTSNPSYRDEVKVKGKVPGVETFTKRTLSVKHV